MRKNKRLPVLFATIGLVSVFFGCGKNTETGEAGNFPENTDWLPTETGRFDPIEIQDVYKTIDGKAVKTELTITSPSGKTQKAENGAFYCEEEGEYVFEFIAGSGSDKVTETKTVRSRLDSTDLFTFTSGGVSKKTETETPDGMGARNNPLKAIGTELTFKGDGAFKFNNTIDLNEISPEENLIELFAIPASVPDYSGFTEATLPGEKYPSGGYTHGTANYTRFEITLTDKYDASNSVVISFFYMPCYSYWNWSEGYISVGDKNTTYALDNGKVNSAPYGSNNVGVVGNYSFFGEGNLPFNLQIDYANKKFYSDTHGNGQKLILDYSDASLLGAANVWNGFTTGECYMEVSFPTVANESSVLITEILGTSVAGKQPEKTNEPEIITDTTGFENGEIPVAQCGKAYKIPEATGVDKISGSCAVTAEIKDENGNLSANENGFFVPAATGEYRLTYVAKNFYGMSAERTYTIHVAEKIEDITVVPAEEYEFIAGIETREPNFTVTGGSGKKTYEAQYILNGKEVLPDEGWLRFSEKGTLVVRFSITDYLGKTEKELVYEVKATANPVLEEAVLPTALYIGREYVFPQVAAFDYENGVAVSTDIFVGGKMLDKSRKYTPQLTDGDRLSVVYTAAANGETASRAYTVRLAEYSLFSHVVLDGEAERTVGERYTLFTSESDFSASFAFPVAANSFSLALGGVRGEDKFSAIKITLSDVADAKKSISVSVSKASEEKLNVKIGGDTYSVSAKWVNALNPNLESVSLGLSNDKIYFKDGNAEVLGEYPIKAWENGSVFKGFTSGGVYAAMKVSGVTGKTSLKLFEFSGQTYTEYSSLSSPKLSLAEELNGGVTALGTNIRIPKAAGYSVLSYKVGVKYAVAAPGGEIIAQGNGEDGGYFTCDEYGRYALNYYLTDEVNDKTETYTYYFEVRDTEAPDVRVKKTDLGKAKIGKKFKLKAAEISDNLGAENCEIKVFVIDVNYNSVDVTNDMYYIPSSVGRYKVVYMAIDKAGNIGLAVCYFTAK